MHGIQPSSLLRRIPLVPQLEKIEKVVYKITIVDRLLTVACL